MPLQPIKQLFHKRVIVILLLGLLAFLGCIAISRIMIYTGTVYRCAPRLEGQCIRQPVVNQQVYLLSGTGNPGTSYTVLQVTQSDETGRFWFFGASLGAVAAVHVGDYQLFFDHTGLLNPYCAFAAWWEGSHDIGMWMPEEYKSSIEDFGEAYPAVRVCPPTVK